MDAPELAANMITFGSKKTRWRWPKCKLEASKWQYINQRLPHPLFPQSMLLLLLPINIPLEETAAFLQAEISNPINITSCELWMHLANQAS